MGVSSRLFGVQSDGSEVFAYSLSNQQGCSVDILTLGAIIHSILIPDRHGNVKDVVTGLATLQDYEVNPAYFGAIIGRVTNRLHVGQGLKVNDLDIKVNCNLGDVCLHGGVSGFDKKLWDHQSGSSESGQWVELTYLSVDGEEGFPGNVRVKATYNLSSSDNTLTLSITASTDQSTIINLTNHAYFNLAGHDHPSIRDHVLSINASHYLPLNHRSLPTGEIRSVELTPFDLREGRNLGQVIDLIVDEAGVKGIDHNFCLHSAGCHGGDAGCHGSDVMRKVLVLADPVSGRSLTVETNQPGMQVYTGNHLEGTLAGKDNTTYTRHSCIALEAQGWPDAPNHRNFPSILLRPGHTYSHITSYKFNAD